jgi:hypothetical protein
MRYWKEETPLQLIGSLIWNTSESLNIPLGSFAPIVFGWMVGSKSTKISTCKKDCKKHVSLGLNANPPLA